MLLVKHRDVYANKKRREVLKNIEVDVINT